MNERIKLIVTGDGSHSLLDTELNETYHSVHGAMRESIHVFIKNGLDFFLRRSATGHVQILEVGFGTGLNALLTLQASHTHQCQIKYTTLEAFPLHAEIWGALNYAEDAAAKTNFKEIHLAGWSQPVAITSHFTLLKIKTTLQDMIFMPATYDLVYFDAFAPNKQPELWQIPLLEKVIASLKPQAVFVTYCAKGQLKRDLKTLGLEVETLPGPPGKKEMVRALKTA